MSEAVWLASLTHFIQCYNNKALEQLNENNLNIFFIHHTIQTHAS